PSKGAVAMHPTHLRVTDPNEPTRRVDGKPESNVDRRFFDLREAGYTGPIDQDGYPADLFVTACPTCRYVHAEGEDCRYDGCEVCGVTYAFGPSPWSTCGICVGAPVGTDAAVPTRAGQASVPVSSVLRSAATYLDRHGWIQGAYYDATATCFTPSACLV